MKYSQSTTVICMLLAPCEGVKINPSKPSGLVPPPKDYQYDVPRQLKQPLNWENTNEEDDFKNSYSHQDLGYKVNFAQEEGDSWTSGYNQDW